MNSRIFSASKIYFDFTGILYSFLIGAVSSIGFKNCLTTILQHCPYSFSIGEALLISQAITLFMISSSIDIYFSFYKTPVLDHEIITNILEVSIVYITFNNENLYIDQ